MCQEQSYQVLVERTYYLLEPGVVIISLVVTSLSISMPDQAYLICNLGQTRLSIVLTRVCETDHKCDQSLVRLRIVNSLSIAVTMAVSNWV